MKGICRRGLFAAGAGAVSAPGSTMNVIQNVRLELLVRRDAPAKVVPRDPARLTVSGAQAAPRRVVVVADTHRYRLLLRLARNHLDHRNPGKEAASPDTRPPGVTAPATQPRHSSGACPENPRGHPSDV